MFGQTHSRVLLALFASLVMLANTGCEPGRVEVIEENEEYSFDDVAAQIAAEEAASEEAREP
ncbi:MAG: hypothetical protein AAGJ40_12500 [Planctomycetota bacterium]